MRIALNIKTRIALLLSVMMCFSAFPGLCPAAMAGTAAPDTESPAPAEVPAASDTGEENTGEASGEAFRISTAQELLDFAEKSREEIYTKGKVFRITEDIDLSGMDFHPIPVFAGTLEGDGHLISGIRIREKDTGTGFIRSLAPTGRVCRLTVSGEIAPRGLMEKVGGIAGENAGYIGDCTFSGSILAREKAGGIAGVNLPSGVIEGCVNRASVTATRRTGGIAGFNEGEIRSSTNMGDINAGRLGVDDLKEEDPEEDSSSVEKLNPDAVELTEDGLLSALENEKKINYTGGIAGASSGVMADCLNRGTVGYLHTGYKTGGIVGYERGIISGCVNEGAVYGRKDVGGIAGQFEPYVENAYFRDSFDDAREAVDRLVELTSRLNEAAQGEDDNTQAHIDLIRDTADDLRGTVDEYREYYQCKDDMAERELRTYTSDLRDRIDRLDVSLKDAKARNAMQSLRQSIDTLEKVMNAAEKASASGVDVDMTNYIGKLLPVADSVLTETDALLDVGADASEELKDVKKDLEAVRESGGRLDDYLRGLYDDYKVDLRATDDSITARTDRLAEEMDILSEGLKDSDSVLRAELDRLTAQMELVNHTMDLGFDEVDAEIERIRNTDSLKEAFDDISDTDEDAPSRGTITYCENRSGVWSDFNGGGIAGTAAVDADVQSDFEVVSSGQVGLKYERTRKATLIHCRNYGDITVKNDCAGGIAGRMDMGAAVKCENYGRIVTEDGDYTGGIAGKSGYLIRDSWSMASLSGNRYIGGIAGLGTKLLRNSAMISVNGQNGGKTGSIAGDLDTDNESVPAEAEENAYVSDGPGAVDGITYAGQAADLSYEEFLELPGLPEDFRTMKVRFNAGGKTVKTLEVPYGGSLSPEEYPEVPQDGDGIGVWEKTDLSDIRQNVTVNAIYSRWVTTIASDEPFPVLLLTGTFYQGTGLSYRIEPLQEAELPEGYSGGGRLVFQIDAEYEQKADSYTVRFLSDEWKEGDCAALPGEGGKTEILETARDGRYTVFDIPGDADTFYILRSARKERKLIFFAAAAAVLALLLLLFLIFRKKEGPGDNQKKEDPGDIGNPPEGLVE